MRNCEIGIVLTRANRIDWTHIVPQLLIYDNQIAFEPAVRRLIDRQSILKHLNNSDFAFEPVALILDGIDLTELDVTKFGLSNNQILKSVLDDLLIKIVYCGADDCRGEKLFPMAWDWSNAVIGRAQIERLSHQLQS